MDEFMKTKKPVVSTSVVTAIARPLLSSVSLTALAESPWYR